MPGDTPMTIWLLKARDDELPQEDNPWEPWYDKCFGMVVVAPSEEEARKLADKAACDENRGEFLSKPIAETLNPWLDPKYSTCTVLSTSVARVVLRDIHTA